MSNLENNVAGGPALVFEASGEIVGIGPEGLVIGRGTGCSLHIADATVSKQHARLAKEGDHHVLVDLSSTNGTFVNGIQVRSKVLADGDHIRFGMVSFRYRMNPSRIFEPIAPETGSSEVRPGRPSFFASDCFRSRAISPPAAIA